MGFLADLKGDIMDEKTITVATPEELMKAVTENTNTVIELNEKPEPPVPRKRKKYSPRQGTACPKCGENLRTLFITLNEGGFRALPLCGGCPKCSEIYKYHLTVAPEIVKKEQYVPTQ